MESNKTSFSSKLFSLGYSLCTGHNMWNSNGKKHQCPGLKNHQLLIKTYQPYSWLILLYSAQEDSDSEYVRAIYEASDIVFRRQRSPWLWDDRLIDFIQHSTLQLFVFKLWVRHRYRLLLSLFLSFLCLLTFYLNRLFVLTPGGFKWRNILSTLHGFTNKVNIKSQWWFYQNLLSSGYCREKTGI